ncbi:transporter substrate-binding domain-containing protein [Frateuria defendens]|uniref:transporter substrate-binding domain-containing protein n=1 Tax=Frateuria defendens TaxID=2219559 RepID=UPI00066FEF3F|nr:transporter substrate-binding domain-containing protein [Frateuria defendens]
MLRRWLVGFALLAAGIVGPGTARSVTLTPEQRGWLDGHKTLTVGISTENRLPYEAYWNGQLQGLGPEYLGALANALGVNVRPKLYTNRPALMAAMCRGEVDLAMNVAMTPEHTQCMAFTLPYVDVEPVIVAPRDDLRYHYDNALPQAHIAYEEGGRTENGVRRRIPSAAGIPVADVAAGLQEVTQGRADVFLGDPYAVASVLRGRGDSGLGIYAQSLIAAETLHFAVPRDRLPLLGALDAALAQMPPKQKQAIQSRWLNTAVDMGKHSSALNLTQEERRWLASLPPLRVGFDTSWAPIAYVDANGRPSGIASDYLDQVADALGLRFTYVTSTSWNDTLELARNGKVDLIAPLNARPDARDNLIHTQSFITLPDVIVVAQNRAPPLAMDDLAGQRVVVSDTSEIPESIKRRMRGASVTLADSTQQALAMVAEHQADAYIGNAAVVDLLIRGSYAGSLKIAAPAQIVSEQTIGVGRPYARLVPYINRALASIPEKERQRIRSTWLWSVYNSGLSWRTLWKTALWISLGALIVIGVLLAAHLRLRREIRRRVNVERELADQLSFREALMASIPFPLMAKDSENRYIAVNKAYEQSFGLKREAMIGHTTLEMAQYDDEWSVRFHRLGAEALHTDSPYHCELRLPDNSGRTRSWLYWLRPFKLSTGRTGGLLGVMVDVSDIRDAERRASALEQRLKRITTNLPAVVYELRRTAEGEVSFPYVAGNTLGIWGMTPEDMEADALASLARVHPDDRTLVLQTVEESARTREPYSIVYRSIAHDRVRWIRAKATPYEEGGDVFWSGMWSDITELRDQAEALAVAKEEAEAAAAAKASFLATMSHEIRTPMNGVLGLLELLGQGPLTADQQRILGMMDDSAQALMQILDDVLDFSKIDAGQLMLAPVPTDLRALIDNVLGVASTLAHEKGLYVRNVVDAALAAELMVDGVRLRQILFNLLSNATKFTEEGEIGVRLEVLPSVPGRQNLRLTVHDTGIGMTPAQQRRLFEPFVQADASITRRFGGTGLGLTICQRLVNMMHGMLTMQSTPGAGTAIAIELGLPVHRMSLPAPLEGYRAVLELSNRDADALAGMLIPLGVAREYRPGHASLRFIDEMDSETMQREGTPPTVIVTEEPSPLGYTVEPDGTCMLSRNPLSWAAVATCCRLTLELDAPAVPAAPPLPARRSAQQGLVLVAEDHPTNRALLHEQLDRLGYRHLIVNDGVEALEALEREADFALLITDCNMPRMDGYTLATAIRGTEAAGRRLPILALTASALPDEAERCAKAGMDALVLKPTSMSTLHEALLRWMPAGEPEAAAPGGVPSKAALSAVEATLDRLFGNDARRAELIAGFITSTRDDLAAIEGAVHRRDAAEAAAGLHRISGAIKIFGADALARQGEQLRLALLQAGLAGQDAALADFRSAVLALAESLCAPVGPV